MATTTLTGGRVGWVKPHVRVALGATIIACLTTGPFVALSRWIARIPLAIETWPYVDTMWFAVIVGAGLFVSDVAGPILSRPVERSVNILAMLAAPAALVLWTLLSVFWSESPGRTPMQAVQMALVVATAVWFGYALTFRQQVVSMFIGLHLLTIASVPASLLLESARFPTDDTWMGLFNNPNSLSPVATLGILAAVGVAVIARSLWVGLAAGACVVVDLVVTWKASSATGWIALGGALCALAALLFARGLGARGVAIARVRVAAVVVVGVVAATLPWTFRWVTRLFGKDSALAGRTLIWDYVLESVEDRWIAGFGFQSFWDNPANRFAPYEGSTAVDAAHSTFMDTLLFLGSVGLLLLLVVVVLSVGYTWWEALGSQSWAMAWWAGIATFALLENVTESMITYHSVFWMLLIAPGFAALRFANVSPTSSNGSAAITKIRQVSTAHTYQ